MKFKTLAVSLALSAGALVGQQAFAASAAITLPPDLTNTTFTNFDWADSGTAYTTGFAPVVGTLFTIRYFAINDAVKNNNIKLSTPTMDSSPDGTKTGNYELTEIATLQERVFSCAADFSTCRFDIVSGNFDVYYDTSANANNALGTGFGDGERLIGGSAFSTTGGTGGQFFTDGSFSGTGSANLKGMVTFTQVACTLAAPACISPALTGTTFGTQLALGSNQTNSPAGGYNGVAFNASNVVFQADGNQTFFVPEPGAVALLGLGLGAMALSQRRRRKAA